MSRIVHEPLHSGCCSCGYKSLQWPVPLTDGPDRLQCPAQQRLLPPTPAWTLKFISCCLIMCVTVTASCAENVCGGISQSKIVYRSSQRLSLWLHVNNLCGVGVDCEFTILFASMFLVLWVRRSRVDSG